MSAKGASLPQFTSWYQEQGEKRRSLLLACAIDNKRGSMYRVLGILKEYLEYMLQWIVSTRTGQEEQQRKSSQGFLERLKGRRGVFNT